MYSTQLITTLEELNDLENDWDDLARRFANPLLEFDWFVSCAQTLHAADELRIVLLYKSGVPVALAPLVLRKTGIVRWLEVMGSRALYEPTGLLFREERDLRQLLREIGKLGYPVNLLRMASDAPPGSLLTSGLSRLGLVLKRESASSCYIETDRDWDSFLATMGKKWRADFRNKKHRAEKQGRVAIDIGCPSAGELTASMDRALAVEAASWKGRQGSSLRDNEPLRGFFTAYTQRAQARGTLRMCFMTLDDRAIAMHIGVETHNGLWFFKMGYDDDWSRLSPGMQLAMETVRYAVDRKLSSYDFLGSEEKWQYAWPVKLRRYCTLLILPFSFYGILGALDVVRTVVAGRIGVFRARRSD